MFAAQRRTKCSHFEGREGCHAVERVLKICCLFMTNFYGCALGEIGKRTGWCNWWSWQTTRYLICETVCETDGEGVGRGQDRRWVCLFLLGCLSCHYSFTDFLQDFLFSLWTSFSKKKKQAKQNVEMKMWSSSRPDLKLGDVTPNWLGLFLSLFPFFLILNFFTEWLQTFLWEKRDSVFTRRDHSGILMSQHKARVLQLPTRPLDIGKGSPFTIWMKARWGSSEDMLSLLGECGRKWSTKREKLL